MLLTLTHHLAATDETAADDLLAAIDRALDVAAARVAEPRDETVAELDAGSVRVRQGVGLLADSQVRITGDHGLATLEVAVPWAPADSDGRKFRAASAFADTVASELTLAS
ncbi:MAG: hypothetical protein AAGA99_25775 [Actinomycetota bacterium]